MPPHTANPVRVLLNVDGSKIWLNAPQVSALRKFDTDGVLRDYWPDSHALRSFAHRGWVLRSRGHFVLTPQGRHAQVALAAYLARKANALKDGVN